MMRIASLTLVFALALPAAAWADTAPANSNHICIDGADVNYTSIPDDQTILFHMNNGKVWRNTLRRSCPNLKFERAFSQVIRGGEICANAHMIRVLHEGNICALGDFSLVPPPAKN
jgi:hypothetical protein